MLLRLQRRAFVDQQVAELDVGVAHVGAEQGFTEEIEELAAGGVLAKELAALVTGAGEGRIGGLGVVLEGVEEGRQQIFFIGLGGCFQLVAVVLGIVAGEVKHTVDQQDYLVQALVDIQCPIASTAARYHQK